MGEIVDFDLGFENPLNFLTVVGVGWGLEVSENQRTTEVSLRGSCTLEGPRRCLSEAAAHWKKGGGDGQAWQHLKPRWVMFPF